jgi:hypothetical protein
MKQDTTLTVRLPHNYRQRLKLVQAELTKRLSGVEIGWSKVIRLALERGAETIEKELGITRKPE